MLSWLFLYGAVIGSFLTVCVHRLPQHESVLAAWRSLVGSPSHCDRCHQRLLARDNIPIFGWLLLGGRCRFCKQGIPIRYPLIEFANGLLFVLVYALEVPLNHWTPVTTSCLSSSLGPSSFENGWGLSPIAMINCRYVYHLILIEALFVASLIDWEKTIIPDSVTLPSLLLGVVGAAAFGKFWLVPVWFQDAGLAETLIPWMPANWSWLMVPVPQWISTHPHLHGLAVSLAGLAAGGGIVWSVRVLGRIALEREVMGFGDVILMAMIGSFIGWQPVVVAFFIAPMLALSVMLISRSFHPEHEFPYGPYLSLGTMVVLLGWHWIWPFAEWYFSLGPALIGIALAMALSLLPVLGLYRMIQRLFGFRLGDYPETASCA